MSIETEAIVLRQTPFKEYDRLVTLFSPLGLLKVLIKAKRRNYLQDAALCSPLTFAEFSLRAGRSDWHFLIEGKVLKAHLDVRQQLDTIIAAEAMASALLTSQWPGKQAPDLFSLFDRFIDFLAQSKNPTTLSTSFWLKILVHEGMLQFSFPLESCLRFGTDRFSLKESISGALEFSKEEEELLTVLSLSRSLQQIDTITISQELQKKIETIFFQSFN